MLELRNISQKYLGNDSLVLHSINLKFEKGKIYAIVGESGSGKTTFAKLIGRFGEPQAGRITIGGINIKHLNPEYLLSHISFVFQEVILFDDTVYNNIRIGKAEASEEEVKAAATAACCQEFIERLPQGYDTVLVIAHRLNTVMNADHIIVLDDGKIVEEGNHNQLMEKEGLYKKLFSIEKKSLEWSL